MTETALIDDPIRASATVNSLVEAGLRVSLDDFCTGYSALVHLKRFPLSSIKLDRTFIAGVASDAADMAVVRGLLPDGRRDGALDSGRGRRDARPARAAASRSAASTRRATSSRRR